MQKRPLTWHKIFATVGGAGLLPVAPGTWGATVGSICLLPLMGATGFGVHAFLAISSLLLTWLGAKVAHDLELEWGEDPKQYVMDEFVGVWVAMIGHAFTGKNIILSFILFRLFDIWKPLGIRRFERIPRGWGVMLDDVAAGIAANVILYVINIF